MKKHFLLDTQPPDNLHKIVIVTTLRSGSNYLERLLGAKNFFNDHNFHQLINDEVSHESDFIQSWEDMRCDCAVYRFHEPPGYHFPNTFEYWNVVAQIVSKCEKVIIHQRKDLRSLVFASYILFFFWGSKGKYTNREQVLQENIVDLHRLKEIYYRIATLVDTFNGWCHRNITHNLQIPTFYEDIDSDVDKFIEKISDFCGFQLSKQQDWTPLDYTQMNSHPILMKEIDRLFGNGGNRVLETMKI